MTPARSRLHTDDTGSIIFGWLGRVTLTLTLLGVICFEVLSIVVTRVGVEDVGQTAGDRALTVYDQTGDANKAFIEADEYAASQDAKLVQKSFEISDDAVAFELKKTAPTLLLFRLDATAHYAEITTNVYAEPFVVGSSTP